MKQPRKPRRANFDALARAHMVLPVDDRGDVVAIDLDDSELGAAREPKLLAETLAALFAECVRVLEDSMTDEPTRAFLNTMIQNAYDGMLDSGKKERCAELALLVRVMADADQSPDACARTACAFFASANSHSTKFSYLKVPNSEIVAVAIRAWRAAKRREKVPRPSAARAGAARAGAARAATVQPSASEIAWEATLKVVKDAGFSVNDAKGLESSVSTFSTRLVAETRDARILAAMAYTAGRQTHESSGAPATLTVEGGKLRRTWSLVPAPSPPGAEIAGAEIAGARTVGVRGGDARRGRVGRSERRR
jgi:hypothetical protein